ncbi:MAG TPA: hypothetical protein DEF42_10285 [Desulfosporosinus sp.]|nr:hypothetical protein [Desulfosporosinus sp.]
MLYKQRFQKIHELLKDHGCKSTFSFRKEYESPTLFGESDFYKPEQDMHSDRTQKEWREKVDANLDVCVPTKKAFSEREQIRFDIYWSQKAKLYRMYISLPTSARSISLSLKRFKTQEELIAEGEVWLAKAGCKKVKKIDFREPKVEKIEQMALF